MILKLHIYSFFSKCIFKINSAPNRNPSNPYPFSPYAHFPNSFHIIKSVQKFHIFIPFNNIYSLILVVIFKIKSVPNRDKVKGKRYKVAFSIVLFQCYFNQHIVFNSFKINTFSLITYPLTLSYRKQTPQQIKISPASATGFWNGLYFYGANFILME